MAQANAPRTAADADEELAALRAELEHQRADNAIKERQLDRYAADLRATSRRERHHARELADSYMATVRALAGAVEARDAYTAHHGDRVTAFGIELAAASGLEVDDESELECAFLLHDIGKVAIPDGILFKAGTLDSHEREVMERHPVIGEARGIGVFWALDLVSNRSTRAMLAPYGGSSPAMNEITAQCRVRGLMPFLNYNRVHAVPPCTVSEAEAKEGLAILDEGFTMVDRHYEG